MSPWDEFQEGRRTQRRRRRQIAAIFTTVCTLGALIMAAFLFLPEQTEEENGWHSLAAEEATAVPSQRAKSTENQPENQEAKGFLVRDAASFLSAPEVQQAAEARLLARAALKPVPKFPTARPAGRQGPLRLAFAPAGSGQAHDWPIGLATTGQTGVIGAASEWRVRPWWKPGWLPSTVDCGEKGTTAVAGHVSWAGRPGPFHDLGAMAAGDRIRCQASHGGWYDYVVTAVVRIDYTETDYYWRSLHENTAELSLYSCTPEITGIIVVRAVLEESPGLARAH